MERRKLVLDKRVLETLLNCGRVNDFRNENTNNPEPLIFIKDNIITIEGVEFDEINGNEFWSEIRNNSPIILRNCVFKKHFILKGHVGDMILDRVVFDEGLLLNVGCKKLEIMECICSGVVHLDLTGATTLEFTKNTFGKLELKGQLSAHIKLNENEITNELTLASNVPQGIFISSLKCPLLKLTSQNIYKDFAITGNSSISEFVLGKINFQGNFLISRSMISKLELKNVSVGGTIILEYSEFNEYMGIHFSSLMERVLISPKCYFSQLHISGILSSKGVLNINESSFDELCFDSFINSGQVRLADVTMRKNSCFRLLHSNFGQAELHNNNFEKSLFEFNKSQISQIFISETDFPENVYKGGLINYPQGKLAFGQLQTVFQKQGDSVRSYEYLAREVRCYYFQLSWISKEFFQKFNLFLNKVSNNFGRNWFQGFVFSFVIGFLFYTLLLISTKEFDFGIPIKIDWNLTSSFLRFMNPLRHFETENLFETYDSKKLGITLSNLSYIWDFLGRIFVAYGYFQTIQAFRKFGKK